MESRSQQLRRRNRKVFGWSMGIAVGLHAAAFLLFPGFRTRLLPYEEAPARELRQTEFAVPILVAVTFGPPSIAEADGERWTEQTDARLEAQRLVRDQEACSVLARGDEPPLAGRVHLRVGSSGRAVVLGVTESTGHGCGDEILTEVADALVYHWLPNERFPAPVDLIQPVYLAEAEREIGRRP